MTGGKRFGLGYLVLPLLVSVGTAHSAIITDSTTFDGFSITYDAAVWGPVRFPYEADAFTGVPPVSQSGFGRFFFDPGFSVSSDGTMGPPRLDVSGQITITASPGWALYYANFTQSGQWSTTGSGVASVAGSVVDISAPNAQFFFVDKRAFTSTLVQGPDNASGFYYIINESSSLSLFGELTIDYDIHLAASSAEPSGYAQLMSDVSDPSYLGGPGPYPGSNIVGTFVSVFYERVAVLPEPSGVALFALALFAMCFARCRVGRERV